MERFLYRLAKSPYADRFILKGALLLTAWGAPVSRPTMQIDLASRTNNQLDHIKEVVSALCGVAADADGIERMPTTKACECDFTRHLREPAFRCNSISGWRRNYSEAYRVEYPTILDFPAPVLRAYPRETVIAEKLEALTAPGLLNSRMKDFYDLALLSRMYSFDGKRLASARSGIGERRSKPNPSGLRGHIAMTPHVLSSGPIRQPKPIRS